MLELCLNFKQIIERLMGVTITIETFDNPLIAGQIFNLLEPYSKQTARADTFCGLIEKKLKELEGK
jgi:hypothetical protein